MPQESIDYDEAEDKFICNINKTVEGECEIKEIGGKVADASNECKVRTICSQYAPVGFRLQTIAPTSNPIPAQNALEKYKKIKSVKKKLQFFFVGLLWVDASYGDERG